MATASVVHPTTARQVRLPDHAERMAKAGVRKPDLSQTDAECRAAIGYAIQRARSVVGWSLKEFAFEMGVDERLAARWESGEKRPPFDRFLTHETFRQPLAVALAELAECEVTTVITARRTR